MTAGHKYHVYCALGGSVYKCKDAVAASGWFESDDAGEAVIINGVSISEWPEDRTDAEAWTALFAEKECGVTCTGVDGPSEPESDTVKVHLQAVEPGAAGNAITLEADGAGARVSGETLEGGADAQRVLVGEMDMEAKVSYQAAAPWTRLEVDVADAGWVQCKDASVEMETRTVPTVPGLYYQVYAEDETHVFYRNTPLLEFLHFGGVGVLLAPGTEVVIQTTPGTEVNMFACAPTDIASVYRPTYPRIDSFNPF